ncbi:MAG: serine--tRNA ligase [Eubacteriales bacterium]
MLDIKFIKENTEYTIKRLADRSGGEAYEADIKQIIELDERRRALIYDTEQLKAKQNAVSKQVPLLKKEGKDVSAIFEEMKELSEKIKQDDAIISETDTKIEALLLNIPNLPHESVPVGKDSEDNQEVRRVGTPRDFTFAPKPHWELGEALGILDPERAGKVTGTRFHFYKGYGAKLERAVVNYYLDTHATSGYTEVFPPFMVNRASMRGTGQLPKFEEDAFKLEGMDYFLIPTAEVPVTNLYRDEIMDGATLPVKYCAYSACFRAEAGAAGRDTRGLIRQHQFNKVELVKFSSPEDSYEQLEALTADAERVLKGLGLAYRVVLLCTGDMGFSSSKTYDIEVYMPSYGKYVEISSCSNFESFQARRANIRYKNNPKDKASYIHTLNGSGVAVGRTVACILENYQNEDGSITVPEVLRPYIGSDKIL